MLVQLQFLMLNLINIGINIFFARLAQLVRALALQARGRKFESFNEHHWRVVIIGSRAVLKTVGRASGFRVRVPNSPPFIYMGI